MMGDIMISIYGLKLANIDTFCYDIVTLICMCKLLVFLHNLIVGIWL